MNIDKASEAKRPDGRSSHDDKSAAVGPAGIPEHRSWRPATPESATQPPVVHRLIYVLEDSQTAQRTLCRLLQGGGWEAKPFASAEAFLDIAPFLAPGCLVIGATMGGLTLQAQLEALGIRFPTIILGRGKGEVGLAVRAMKAGAVDYLERPFSAQQLVSAVAAGVEQLGARAERNGAAALAASRLTEMPMREREVLAGLLAGGTNKTIGRDLRISPRTVEVYRGRLMERLGAHSFSEAIAIALQAGLGPACDHPAQH